MLLICQTVLLNRVGFFAKRGGDFRSSIADPKGVAQSLLQSTNSHDIPFNKMTSNFLVLLKHF